jgi:4-amino-4-deoxy-L-arabinose transferase-like glycosyltransferase
VVHRLPSGTPTPLIATMVYSKLFSDFCRRNRLAIFVLLPVFLATAAFLFMGVPILQPHVAYRYSVGFADGYNLIAENLANGYGYRWRADMAGTMTREPGYPLLLAAAFKVAGPSIEVARLLNLLLTVGIAFMLITLTRRMRTDPRVPVVAALLFLIYPGTLIAEARGGVEILFIFVGFGFVLAMHRAVEKGGIWPYFVAGLMFGVVVQVRSTPITFPALLLLYALFTAKGARQRGIAAFRVAILVVGMGLVMVPWVVRNYRLVHDFVPFSTIQELASQEGLYICRNVSFGVDDYRVIRQAGRIRTELARNLGMRFEGVDYFQMFYDAHDELAFNRLLYKTTRREYAKNPGLLVWCVGKNLFNFWFLGKTWNVTKLNIVVQVPILALVFYGLTIVWRRGGLRNMAILLIYAASIAMTHILVISEARYSIPVFAFLAIPAGEACTAIWDEFRRHKRVVPGSLRKPLPAPR